MIATGGAGELARRLGEPGGRALIADGLSLRLRGAPLVMDDILSSWTVAELAAVSLWLRDVTARTSDDLAISPCQFTPTAAESHQWKTLRGWDFAHQFLAGLRPAVGDSIEICCPGCLMDMTAALAVIAVEATILQWGGDPALEAYVVSGGDLPAGRDRQRAHAAASRPAPAFTPSAAEAPSAP